MFNNDDKDKIWDAYYTFEGILYNSNDQQIIEYLLHNFSSQDFLELPIVLDLVSYKKINILNLLFKKNITLTYQGDDGSNALHVACGASGSLACVKFFIENKILTNINKKSEKYGDTPLTLAICYGHKDIVSYLQQKFNVRSVNFQELDIILDRVLSNQNRSK